MFVFWSAYINVLLAYLEVEFIVIGKTNEYETEYERRNSKLGRIKINTTS